MNKPTRELMEELKQHACGLVYELGVGLIVDYKLLEDLASGILSKPKKDIDRNEIH